VCWLNVSDSFSVHHQKLKTAHTASGIGLALYVQFWAADDGQENRPKHVERLTEKNKSWNIASCWLYPVNIYCCVCWDAVDQILFCPSYWWLLLYNSLCFCTFQRQIKQYDNSHCTAVYTYRTEGIVMLLMFTAWTVWMCLMCSFCLIYVSMLTRPAFSVKCLLNISTRYWCKLLQILFWLPSTQKVSGIYIWCECIQSHFSILMFPTVLVILWHSHLYFSVLLLLHLSPTSLILNISCLSFLTLPLHLLQCKFPPPRRTYCHLEQKSLWPHHSSWPRQKAISISTVLVTGVRHLCCSLNQL